MKSIHASLWAWEISALAGVFASCAGLVTLLAVFDGRAVFDWKSITLNTIVSTISLLLRGFLIYSIAECIGQWKWILFDRSERTLMDFERIDSASRGPLGSLSLSWQKDMPWMLRLGALVTVLALAVDPFSQQLVQVENKISKVYEPFEAGGMGLPATTPRAYSYNRGNLFKTNETGYGVLDDHSVQIGARPELSMEAAILKGISTHDMLIKSGLDYSCDATCTWEPFQTLAVCSRCSNMAHRLKRVKNFGDVFTHMGVSDIKIHLENATAVVLPNGHFLANLDGCLTEKSALDKGCEWAMPGGDTVRVPGNLMASYGTSNPKNTLSMQDLDTMIWSMTVLYLDEEQRGWGPVSEWDGPGEEPDAYYFNITDPIRKDPDADLNRWPGSPVQAEECALYYCIQTVEDSFENNTLDEYLAGIEDFVRKPESWQSRSEGRAASANISLEFNDRNAAQEMSDLVLHYANKSAEQNDFSISHEAVMSISAYLQETFRTPWKNESKAFELVRERVTDASVLPNGRIKSFGLYEPGSLEGLYTKDYPSIRNRISNLAISMTVEMRNSAGEILDLPDGVYPDRETRGLDNPKFGTTHISNTVYRAEWYWISLHGVIVFFGVLFCVATLFRARPDSREQVIWKNHSLAALRHGAVIGQRLGRATTIRGLEEAATNETAKIPFIQPFKGPSPSISEDNVEKQGEAALPSRTSPDSSERC